MTKEEQSKKDPAVSESKICRDIIDRHSIMASQVISLIIENVGTKLNRSELANLRHQINGSFTKHTNGLIEQVSKIFTS